MQSLNGYATLTQRLQWEISLTKILSIAGIVWYCLLVSVASAELDLVVLWPSSGFTTNNHEVQVRGYLGASEGATAVVSISTPAGVQDFAATYLALDAFAVDLGGQQDIAGIAFQAVEEQGLAWGPRKVRISFSDDGQTFDSAVVVGIPLESDANTKPSTVALPASRVARYVQVQILEGWQADSVQIHQVFLFNRSGDRVRALVASVSLRVPLDRNHEAIFDAPVPVRDGENRIMLRAELEVVPFDARVHADTEAIQLTKLAQLNEENAQQGQFVLSDGWQIELLAPVDAFGETLQGVEMLPILPEEIPQSTYRGNRQMVTGTSPVLGYRFVLSHRTSFPAQATAFLQTQPPELAVDGRFDYPSTWVTSLVPLPVSLTVDLGSLQMLGEIRVHAHVDGGESLGPNRATILVSEDGTQFQEVLQQEAFEDKTTRIVLPAAFLARHVRMRIEESKQANNIQINEVEFLDDTGAAILPLISSERVTLQRSVLLTMFYEDEDLRQASVVDPSRLAFFILNPESTSGNSSGFWQLVGGRVSEEERSVSVQLNHLGPIALFESLPTQIEAEWSFNPFSPNGDGIADTTGLTLRLASASPETPTELSIEVFDLGGRRVRSLLERESITTDSVHAQWDGTDRTGRIVPIGPYIYQVETTNQVFRGTIVVAK